MVWVFAGCSNLGPKMVAVDRFDYNTAIANSWKQQTLLNIVKLRYADMPVFVEVASVVSGYTLESSLNLGGTVTSAGDGLGDFLSLGTAGKYTDRPTITYAPITGGKFNENFMTPIPPRAVLFLMQSGWPADLIFPMTVDSINGLSSRVSVGSNQRLGDPDYYRAIFLFRKIQKSGAISMRIVKEDSGKETTVLLIHRKKIAPEIKEAHLELRQLLGLKLDAKELRVTYGLLPRTDREIAILTRSMLHIMVELAGQVDVPSQHVAGGLTLPSLTSSGESEDLGGRLFQVKHSIDEPQNPFVAVRYEGHWFWIDKKDFRSKRTFAFLMILFSLSETGGKVDLPLVTIPSG